jgi:hypothetical protein
MPASINELGNAVFYSFLMFLVIAMLGIPVPIGLFLCHIVVFVACWIAGN